MFQKLTSSLHRSIQIALVCAVVFICIPSSNSDATEGIGFQARFQRSVFLVSDPYYNVDESAPPSIGVKLSLRGAIRPKTTIDSATFSPPRLRFVTTLRNNSKLVSTSEDAYEFARARFYRYAQAKLDSLSYSSLLESKKDKRRTGVSLGVALPKKLDRLFGEGGGNLRLTGSMRVSLGGEVRYSDGLQSSAVQQSKGLNLKMDQVSRFEMSGTIGTKISVRLAQDSKTTIPLANRIQIRYKGDDDDIVKAIEAGNTNLNLPNTQFVGYSSQIQGLFGFKTEAVLGNLGLTAIASQEKGSSEKAVIGAEDDESASIIRDYQYAEGRLFDFAYRQSDPLSTGGVFDFLPGDSITRVEVYETINRPDQVLTKADMFINPDDPSRYQYQALDQNVVRLEFDKDYTWEQIPSDSFWVIHFNTAKQGTIGIYYEFVRARSGGGFDTLKVGDHSGSRLILKYLRSTALYNSNANPAWNLMWRNVYSVPRGSQLKDLKVRVFKGATAIQGTDAALDYQIDNGGQSQGKLIAILGLDQYTEGGQRQKDDQVDNRRERFRPDWGLLIFPSRFPFADDNITFVNESGIATPPLRPTTFKSVFYDKDPSTVGTASLYYIQLASRSRSSIIRLNRTNIIEGSEKVLLDGIALTRDTDYKIQYDFGQITLTSDRALDPNAKLQVEFEYAPFLSLAKKTLLGLRAEYRLSKDARIGSTLIYKSDKAQDRKPRIGQETSKSSVYDLDGAATFYPKALTKVINAIPFVSTTAVSTLSLSGEYAQSNPNPNVLGEAYIDDFEGATEQISIATNHSTWTRGSRPRTLLYPAAHETKMLWFNPGGIPFDEVYQGERQASEGTIIPLYLIFRPSDSTYIRRDSVGPSYASIMRYFGNRIDESRLQLFEVRLQGDSGLLHFDFGNISEDVNGDNQDNTEDANSNGISDPDEDKGLDKRFDADEIGPDSTVYDPLTNPDPSGDNFYFRSGDQISGKCPLEQQGLCDDPRFRYEWVNGTEGNINYLPVIGRVDRESLGPGGFLNADNYFSFTIDLGDTNSLNSFYVPGSRNDSGWATFRIPIREPIALTSTVGDPRWDNITHIRFWREAAIDQRTPDTIAIANWYFVQAYWQDTLISTNPNATFVVASVSEEENTFDPPPGVEDYTDQVTGVTESQRALSMKYTNFLPGDTGFAIRRLLQGERYTGYNRMRMYVHGPELDPADSIQFLLRLGNDSLNYYQFATQLQSGWNEQNYVDIDFQKLTRLKDSLILELQPGEQVIGTDGQYSVRGRPSLINIGYYSLGVVNTSSATISSGEVWVDELRVAEPRRDKGTAYRYSISGTGADLFSYSLNYENKDAFFRSVSTTTRGGDRDNLGSGSSAEQYSWQVSMNVERFLPKSWGASLPISIGQSQTTNRPLLRSGTDIVLPESIREEEKSVSRSKRFSITESFRGPNKNPLFGILLNRQRVSLSISQSDGFSVTQPYRFSDAYNLSASYDMGIKKFPKLALFKWTKGIPFLKRLEKSRLLLYPGDWTWNATFDRSLSITQDPGGRRTSNVTRGLQGRTSLSLRPFDNLNSTFRAGSTWDMSRTDSVKFTLRGINLGRQTAYDQNVAVDYDPKLLKWLTAKGTYTANYTERLDNSSLTRNGTMSNAVRLNGVFSQTLLFAKPKALKMPPQKPFELPGFVIDKNVWYPPMAFDSTLFKREWATPMLPTRSMVDALRPPKPAYPFYDAPFSLMRSLVGWLKPLSYSFSSGYNNSTPGMVSRPSLGFRFGLVQKADVELRQVGATVARTKTNAMEFGTGTRFFGGGGNGLSVDVRYKRSENEDVQRAGGNLTRTVSQTWPKVDINIGQMPKFPVFRKQINDFIAIFAPKTGYELSERTQINLSLGEKVTAYSKTESFSPLLNLSFRPSKSMTLSLNQTLSKSTSDQYNAVNASRQSQTIQKRRTTGISLKYNFSSPSGFVFPIFGRIRFSSIVSLSVDASFNSDQTSTRSVLAGTNFLQDPVETVNKKSLTITPVVSYQFSNQIKGGLQGYFQDSKDKTSPDSHARSVNAFVEIQF